MPARWMTWERIVRDEGHHERRVHAGRSTRLLRLAGYAAHAGALAERAAGAPVCQPESDGSRYDDQDMVADCRQRLRTMAGHVCIPDELAKDEIGTCAAVSPWRSQRASRSEGRGRPADSINCPRASNARWIIYNGASGYILLTARW